MTQRHHAVRDGFDQPLVVDRTDRAGNAVERLEGHAEALAERAQIGFLAERAGCDQDAVGAGAERGRPARGGLDHIGVEQRADAVEFREGLRFGRGVRERQVPRIDRGAVGGLAKGYPRAGERRSRTNSERHPPPCALASSGRC